MKTVLRKRYFFFAALLFASLFLFPSSRAQTIEELQQKIEQKSAEIKKLEEEARKYRDEINFSQNRGKTLKDELARIGRAISKLRSDIAVTEKKIERAAYQIDELHIDILAKESSIGKMRSGLTGVLQDISERDEKPLFMVLLATQLSDFLGQLEKSEMMQKKALSSLDTLRALKHGLETKKIEAESKKNELSDLDTALKNQKAMQEGTRRDRNNLLSATKNEEKRYQTLLKTTEQKQEEILREMEELEEELRKQIDPNSLPTKIKGLLAWPLRGLLTQGYGETPFTRTVGRDFYKFHNGIDIRAQPGTSVAAPLDGKVLATGNTDIFCPRGAYGKYIVIDHGNNLATMYAHLSQFNVQAGQTIKAGDIIGNTGNTGLSTGPHLHFTVYDARTVQIRRGPTGTCGVLPYGGSLNPLEYLL